MPLPVARTNSRGKNGIAERIKTLGSLCERPKCSDKDPRGGTD